MPGVTIQVQENEEAEAGAPEQAEAEAIEALSSDAVAIAAIEADKEIALAEIHQETRLAEAEIYAEANEQNTAQDNELWDSLNQLSSEVRILSETVATLLTAQIVEQETLSSLEEAEAMEAEMLTAPESDLTQSDTLPETSSMGTEHSEKSAEENPAEIPPILEVDGKPIIRLI